MKNCSDHTPIPHDITSDRVNVLMQTGIQGCIVFMVLMVTLLSGCGDFASNLESKPTALGSTNEIVIIAEDKIWEGPTGDTVQFYYSAPYPIMPTPEPLFDLRHFTVRDLQDDVLRRELRTYMVLADLNDTEAQTTKLVMADLGDEKIRRASEDPEYFSSVGQDKWARGQIVFYVFGHGQDALQGNIIKAFPAISRRIREHDKGQLHAATYLDGVSFKVSNLIKDKFGFKIDVPGSYQVALDDDNFLWIRRDTRDITTNLAIRTFRYTDEDELSRDGIIKMRDRLGILVQGGSIGSFMRTNAEDLPVFTYQKEIDGRYTIESRGIWELTEDYLGGPFLNFAVLNGDRIIMIDAFVYAPGKDKRDYIQQLEYVVSGLAFVN